MLTHYHSRPCAHIISPYSWSWPCSCNEPAESAQVTPKSAEQRLLAENAALDNTAVAKFVQSRLEDDVKQPHNPSSETIQLFKDHAVVDLIDKW